jgi:alanyl-tRNA synthetase
MGLERMALVLQNAATIYDTDLLKPIVEFTAQMASRR